MVSAPGAKILSVYPPGNAPGAWTQIRHCRSPVCLFFSVWANFTACSCEALLDLRAVIRQVKRGAGFRPGLHLPERARQFSLYYFRKVEPVLRLVIFCLLRPTGYLPALPLVTLRGILPDGRYSFGSRFLSAGRAVLLSLAGFAANTILLVGPPEGWREACSGVVVGLQFEFARIYSPWKSFGTIFWVWPRSDAATRHVVSCRPLSWLS